MNGKTNSTENKVIADTIICTCSPTDLMPFGDCICQVPKKNLTVLKLESLTEAIKTVDYKIQHLTPYFSQAQIRCWKRNRIDLKKKLKFFQGIRKLQLSGKSPKQILAEPHRQIV